MYIYMHKVITFEWNSEKNKENVLKHGVAFQEAREAFFDPNRVLVKDVSHSTHEERFFCIGLVSEAILMVRFTIRNNKIRIFGAGHWRKGRKLYEKINKIHR